MEAPDSYPKYWLTRWEERVRFINVEHDVLPWPGAFTSLWNCNQDWCVFGYGDNEILTHGAYLGCVKFSREFIEATPDLWTSMPDEIRDWRHCDGWLRKYAQAHGLQFHQHLPSVNHLH
jgi:hypothetical protein